MVQIIARMSVFLMTIAPFCSALGIRETYFNHFVPFFMTKDTHFSSRVELQVYGHSVSDDFTINFKCSPPNGFCSGLTGNDGIKIEQGRRWTKKFTMIEGPSTTGIQQGGILCIASPMPVQMTVKSFLSTDCVTMYMQNAIDIGKGHKTKSAVPLIGPDAFLAIVPQLGVGTNKRPIKVDLTLRGLTQDEWEVVARNNDPKNPFNTKKTASIKIALEETYMFVLRDFPDLKNATGILVEADGYIGVYTGSSDRSSDPTRGCQRGHTIVQVVVGPAPNDHRHFIVHKIPIGENKNDVTNVYVSSVSENIDIEITTEGSKEIKRIHESGDTLKLHIPEHTHIMKIVARAGVLVYMATRLTSGSTSDVSLMQLNSLNNYVNEFEMSSQDVPSQDMNFIIIMQSHKYLLRQHVRANGKFLINDKTLSAAINEGWIVKTDIHHDAPNFTSYSAIGLKLLSKTTIEEKMKNYTGRDHNYTNPLYLKIHSDIPFMIEFSLQNKKSIINFTARKKLYKDLVCSNSYPYLDDGRDNDCDGLLDEDVYDNGIDDDGDGLVDEDTSLINYWNEGKGCKEWIRKCSLECRGVGHITEVRQCQIPPSVMVGERHGTHRASVKCDTTNTACDAECEAGYWGESCGQRCAETCTLYGKCFKDDGACQYCPMGYGGAVCNQMCPEGMFGPSCKKKCSTFCESGQCNQINGECETAYISNWPYAAVSTFLLLIPSGAILVHALVFLTKNMTRMWQFRDPSFRS